MLSREEGSIGDISANEAKNTDSLLSGKGTLLVCVHVHQDTQVLFCRAAFHLSGLELFLPRCMLLLMFLFVVLSAHIPRLSVYSEF